jgi:hypothetical protein
MILSILVTLASVATLLFMLVRAFTGRCGTAMGGRPTIGRRALPARLAIFQQLGAPEAMRVA